MIQAYPIDTNKCTVIEQLFSLPITTIDCVNWEKFPYKPYVSVQLGYSSTDLAILFEVEENHLRGLTLDDCGPVYEDSCCEVFYGRSIQ